MHMHAHITAGSGPQLSILTVFYVNMKSIRSSTGSRTMYVIYEVSHRATSTTARDKQQSHVQNADTNGCFTNPYLSKGYHVTSTIEEPFYEEQLNKMITYSPQLVFT